MSKKNWRFKKGQQRPEPKPAPKDSPVTAILRQIGKRYGEEVPNNVLRDLALVQERADVVGDKNPVAVFTQFVDRVIAGYPPGEGAKLLPFRSAIAQTPQADMEAVVDQLDEIRGVAAGRRLWEEAAMNFYERTGVSLTIRNIV